MKNLFFFTLFILSILLSCSKTPIEEISKIYTNYYISNSSSSLNELTHIIKNHKTLIKTVKHSSNRGEWKEGAVVFNDITKKPFTIGYSTPKIKTEKKLLPLIIYLHGGTGTIRTDKGAHAWDQLEFLQNNIDIFLASPSANREAPWWSVAGLNRIEMTLRYMLLNYPIDPDKIFLAGVSDGGSSCYAAANCMGDLFAGFFSISGFGELVEFMGIPLSTQNLAKCNIYNINATDDRLYPIQRVNAFLKKLQDSGVVIKQKIYENEKHGFEYKLQEKDTLVALINRWKRDEYWGFNQNLSPNLPNIVNNIVDIKFISNANNFSINGFYSNDTLTIKSFGIKSIDFITNKKSIVIKANSKVKKYKVTQKIDIKEGIVLSRAIKPKQDNRVIHLIF